VPRDGHQARVRARLDRAALVVGQPAVALLGVDDPRWNARLARPLGGPFIPGSSNTLCSASRGPVSRSVQSTSTPHPSPRFGRYPESEQRTALPGADDGGNQGPVVGRLRKSFDETRTTRLIV
jgi:hypothetical protein